MFIRFFRRDLIALALTGIFLLPGSLMAQGIKDGDVVSVQYLLTLANGTRVTFSRPGVPLIVTMGEKSIFSLVEAALLGMRRHEEKSVYLKAENAYGPVQTQKFQAIKLSKLPENARRIGATIIATNPQGKEQQVLVTKIQGDEATLNFNHPLAGQDLIFKLKVLKIKPAMSR